MKTLKEEYNELDRKVMARFDMLADGEVINIIAHDIVEGGGKADPDEMDMVKLFKIHQYENEFYLSDLPNVTYFTDNGIKDAFVMMVDHGEIRTVDNEGVYVDLGYHDIFNTYDLINLIERMEMYSKTAKLEEFINKVK